MEIKNEQESASFSLLYLSKGDKMSSAFTFDGFTRSGNFDISAGLFKKSSAGFNHSEVCFITS